MMTGKFMKAMRRPCAIVPLVLMHHDAALDKL